MHPTSPREFGCRSLNIKTYKAKNRDVKQPCVSCRNHDLLIFPSSDISPWHFWFLVFCWDFLHISSLLFSSPFSPSQPFSQLLSARLSSISALLRSYQLFSVSALCSSSRFFCAKHKNSSASTYIHLKPPWRIKLLRLASSMFRNTIEPTCSRNIEQHAATPRRSASRQLQTHNRATWGKRASTNLWNIMSTAGADPSGTVSFRNCRAAVLPYPSSVLKNIGFRASTNSQKYVSSEASCNLH